MKKYLLLALTLLATSVYSQTIIMEEYGGVYKIPCLVNGAKMKLIFDTGASNVSLSMAMAEYLLDNEYISKDDIIGKGKSSVADGSIVDHVIINLRDIEIAGLHLTNVEAIVIDGQNAPLLLGQSAIQKLGKITLEGNVLIIGDNNTNEYSQDYWIDKAYNYYNDGLNRKAYEAFEQAAALGSLTDYSMYFYAISAQNIKEYKKALGLINKITDYDYLMSIGLDVYYRIGSIYADCDMPNDAMDYFKLSYKSEIAEQTKLDKAELAFIIYLYYMENENYKVAGDYIVNVINDVCAYYQVDFDYLLRDSKGELNKNEQSIRALNSNIDKYLFESVWVIYKSNMSSFPQFMDKVCYWAEHGNAPARNYLLNIGFDCSKLYLFYE